MKRYRPEQIVAKLRQAHVAKQHDFRGHPSTARVKGIPTALCHAERSREPALSLSDGPLRGAKPNGGLAVAVSPFIPHSEFRVSLGGHQSEMRCFSPHPQAYLRRATMWAPGSRNRNPARSRRPTAKAIKNVPRNFGNRAQF